MSKRLVIDANILIRAVLGTRASALLETYADSTNFLSVDEAFEDAAKYVPGIITKFGGDEKALSAALRSLSGWGTLLRSFRLKP